MPNPKRRHSKTRQRDRRTHDKAVMPTVSVDPTTGVSHVRHRAHLHEGELFYKGKKILSKGE
jgi:large subunit ribosomal protein L32